MSDLIFFLAWNGAVFGLGFWIGRITERRAFRRRLKARRSGMTS
jgi:hypothetical protein